MLISALHTTGWPMKYVGTLHTKLVNIYRVGQNHIYTAYIWYSWQGYHQIYGHIRCIYTVLAIPKRN